MDSKREEIKHHLEILFSAKELRDTSQHLKPDKNLDRIALFEKANVPVHGCLSWWNFEDGIAKYILKWPGPAKEGPMGSGMVMPTVFNPGLNYPTIESIDRYGVIVSVRLDTLANSIEWLVTDLNKQIEEQCSDEIKKSRPATGVSMTIDILLNNDHP